MMTIRQTLTVCLSALTLVAVAALSADDKQSDSGVFERRDGYEEARFGAREVVIKTRGGEKRLRVSLSTLRLTESKKMTEIKLPSSGIALLQHAAGDATIQTGKEKFEPLEGEWLRIGLPSDLRLSAGDDSILLDLIVIEETK